MVYDPEAPAEANARRCARPPRRSSPARSPRRCATSQTTPGRSPRATGSASSAATASSPSRADAARRRHGAARPPRRRRPRARHRHHRRRRRRGHDGRDRGVARRRPSRRRGRGARRRPAAVPVPLRRRVTAPPVTAAPITLRELATIDVARLQGVGERKREALRDARASRPCSTSSRLPAALGRPHERGPRQRPRHRAGGARAGDGALGAQADRRATGARSSRPSSATAPAGCTSCSSTSRGGSASCTPGLQVALFGKADSYRGGLQMTNPIVDLIGDRTGRIVPIYPQSEKAQLNTWEIAGWVENALERSPQRGLADPVPAGRASAARARSTGGARCTTSTCRSRWPTRSRPAGGWRSTSCCACSSCS